MTFIALVAGFLIVLTVLSALAAADRVPDTHTEATQHGDYRF